MFDPDPPGERKREETGEVPLRGSSFNTRNRVVLWGRVGGHGARGSRRQALLPPGRVVCVCACQAVPVLPARTGRELVAPLPHPGPQRGRLVLAGYAGGEQGPASPWDITTVTSWPPLRLLRRVRAGRGCGGACPLQPRRDEGNVCVCLCTRILFNVYVSTIYTPRRWGLYIYSIPCLGSANSEGQNDFASGTETL